MWIYTICSKRICAIIFSKLVPINYTTDGLQLTERKARNYIRRTG